MIFLKLRIVNLHIYKKRKIISMSKNIKIIERDIIKLALCSLNSMTCLYSHF